jgi:TRAP-type C4-dicarboxylate transport system permease small subunit
MKALAQRGLAALQHVENWLLAALVLVLVGLAGAQIILRNFFDTGLSWADPLLRALVLWTGMLGALTAVRDDKHIALDVLQRFLAPQAQRIARVFTLGFTAALCAAMAWFSVDLVKIDLGSGSNAFAGVPSWLVETILPAGFGLMGLRFALRAFAPPAHVPALIHEPESPPP